MALSPCQQGERQASISTRNVNIFRHPFCPEHLGLGRRNNVKPIGIRNCGHTRKCTMFEGTTDKRPHRGEIGSTFVGVRSPSKVHRGQLAGERTSDSSG
jgi:hypothetical protein